MTRLSIDISDDIHQFLKVHTAYKNETIVHFVREAIYEKMNCEKELNYETSKSVENSLNGIGVTNSNNVEDLFKEIYKELD
jgi:antitoxin component of RelBE/YafQ-DinJ toxin-antitoxin module